MFFWRELGENDRVSHQSLSYWTALYKLLLTRPRSQGSFLPVPTKRRVGQRTWGRGCSWLNFTPRLAENTGWTWLSLLYFPLFWHWSRFKVKIVFKYAGVVVTTVAFTFLVSADGAVCRTVCRNLLFADGAVYGNVYKDERLRLCLLSYNVDQLGCC